MHIVTCTQIHDTYPSPFLFLFLSHSHLHHCWSVSSSAASCSRRRLHRRRHHRYVSSSSSSPSSSPPLRASPPPPVRPSCCRPCRCRRHPSPPPSFSASSSFDPSRFRCRCLPSQSRPSPYDPAPGLSSPPACPRLRLRICRLKDTKRNFGNKGILYCRFARNCFLKNLSDFVRIWSIPAKFYDLSEQIGENGKTGKDFEKIGDLYKGCESVCEKKSEIIRNAWKDVLFSALKVWKWGFVKSKKVWNQIKNWTPTFLFEEQKKSEIRLKTELPHSCLENSADLLEVVFSKTCQNTSESNRFQPSFMPSLYSLPEKTWKDFEKIGDLYHF